METKKAQTPELIRREPLNPPFQARQSADSSQFNGTIPDASQEEKDSNRRRSMSCCNLNDVSKQIISKGQLERVWFSCFDYKEIQKSREPVRVDTKTNFDYSRGMVRFYKNFV